MRNIDWGWIGCGVPWLLVGFVFGYIVGRIQNGFQDNKESRMVNRDERGIFRYPLLADVAALLVVIITVFAAIQSQAASNDAQDAIAEVKVQTDVRNSETKCVSTVVFATIQALNERTTYTIKQAQANVALQRAQALLIDFFLTATPTTPEEEGRAAISRYFGALQTFTKLAAKTAGKTKQYEYPTEEEFLVCIHRARNPAQEDS